MRIFLARLRGFFLRRTLDRQLREELEFHLQMEAERNRRRGMPPEEAAQAARRAFGGVAQTQEIYREQGGLPMLETLVRDVQYGLRMIRRSPGFTIVAVLSLALGIGANTAIFTLIDAVMLRALAVRSPGELVSVGDAGNPNSWGHGTPRLNVLSYPLYQRLRDENHTFTALLAAGPTGRLDMTMSMTMGMSMGMTIAASAPERIRGRFVSGNYFDVLGVPALLGRTFTDEGPEVVISFDYWQNRFAADPGILGRTIRLNHVIFTIVGVGPRGFSGEVVGNATDIWIPAGIEPQLNPGDPRLTDPNSNWLLLMGRLKPGASVAAARAEMTMLARRALIDYAGANLSPARRREIAMQTVDVEPCAKGFSAVRKRESQPLAILMIVVGLVLLIACANVANLLLARATSRQKEISVRLAVGASRSRLIRQLLTESALLAGMGGALGLLLAWWASGLLLRLASNGPDPIPLDVRPNALVLAFTAGVSVLTGILFGLVPALRSTRVDLAPSLKENARGANAGRFRIGKLLVVGQVALSLLLLVGAGLFIRSLLNMETLDVGYARAHLVLLEIDPGALGHAQSQQLPMAARVMERLRTVPGVTGVTVSENGIFSGTDSGTSALRIDGFSSTSKEALTSRYDEVGPHYFQIVGVPVLAGRDFDERDRAGAPPVAILNDAMARFYFGDRSPLGRSMWNGADHYTIVGVVKDMKERELKRPAERRFYTPLFQETDLLDAINFEIRTRDDTAGMLPAIRCEMESFDRNVKILSLEPVTVLIDRSISEERLIAQLSGFFAFLALLLAATGLYGVMAYATSQRTGEIGIRMALGAGRAEVIAMVLGETLLLVAAGLAIGVPAALAASRLIAARLVGLSAGDLTTFAGDLATLAAAMLLLLLVAVIAGFAPAQRAARIDPMAALRQE